MKSAVKLSLSLVVALVAFLPARASAEVYTFSYCLENNSGLCETVADQIQVEVTESAEAGWVNFTFTNNIGIQSSVTDLYFDATGFLTQMKILYESDGVNFTAGSASPPTVPGAGSATPPFEVSSSLMADSDAPAQPNGINAVGESLTISFKMANNIDFGEVIAAIDLGPGTDQGIRIAAHVQGVGLGQSDTMICCSSGGDDPGFPSPEPATMSLFGLAAVAAASRLRKRQTL